MLFVLDSNEYIFALGISTKPECGIVLDSILDTYPRNTIRIPRMIVEEVNRHLTMEGGKEFFEFINSITTIDEDIIVPFELGVKYESEGLKPADAFIAAYVEWVGADALVTENRHFLSRHPALPFKVLNARNCLKLIKV